MLGWKVEEDPHDVLRVKLGGDVDMLDMVCTVTWHPQKDGGLVVVLDPTPDDRRVIVDAAYHAAATAPEFKLKL